MAWRTYEQKLNSRYIELKDMPSAKKEYSLSFGNLAGGLNIAELDYRLNANESPELKNLMWRDGVLSCRNGQMWVNSTELGTCLSAYNELWHGYIICHIGSKIYAYNSTTGVATQIYDGAPLIRGTFFMYNYKMYYKTKGAYLEITAAKSGNVWTFSCSSITAYVPIIVINADPDSGAGDSYQPENRLSPDKTIWYNAKDKLSSSCSNTQLAVVILESTYLNKISRTAGTNIFTCNGTTWSPDIDEYGISVTGTPNNGDTITVVYETTKRYQLPVKGKQLIKVVVDGVEKTTDTHTIEFETVGEAHELSATINEATWRAGELGTGTFEFIYSPQEQEVPGWYLNGVLKNLATLGVTLTGTPVSGDTMTITYAIGNYSYDQVNGIVVFDVAPPTTIPPTNNTVQITYRLENTTAYNNIMDCKYVAVYGGTGSLCVVMAGSETQPNAYFWNGQDQTIMNPTYFPIEQYQLASDVVDPITGFGKQQSYLVIFKENSVGRTIINTETINDRLYIDLPFTPINGKIGCDLPWTIQLIDNNLVWCNTTQGVHLLKDSSSAYENNIACVSTKVNGSNEVQGLLPAVRNADINSICSCDDEKRYWLNAGNKVWVWDYNISDYNEPSWFYFDNISAVAFITEKEDLWHVDSKGRLTKFANIFSDYDEGIDKIYRFAVQAFGGYELLKNVNSVIINVRGDTDTDTQLEYITDYENRKDLTPIVTYAWHLVPRNLTYRDLSGTGFAQTFKRKPYCRHVRHFTMRLSNSIAGQNLSIVSAQIFYNYQGAQR